MTAGKCYGRMCAAHSELFDGLFSRSKQENGTQQQTLAGSIAASATHLVNNPGTILEAVLSRIAQKHTSLDIRPVQCSMVYQNPFEAIAEIHWPMAHALRTLENASTPLRPAIAQWSPESWWAKKPTEPTR